MEFLPTNFSENDDESDCELVIDEPEVTEATERPVIETPKQKKKPIKKKKSIKKKSPDASDGATPKEKTEVVLQTTSTNKIINMTEMFDKNKLNHIIQHKQYFKGQMRDRCFNLDKDHFKIAETYLKNSLNGEIDVSYKQNDNKGRFYSIGALSLQSMAREIRHSIAKDYYVDIDIVNAHPVILEHLCKVNGYNHKYLSMYIKNRDKYIKQLKINNEDGKKTFLSLTNGGKQAYNDLAIKTKFITSYMDEMLVLHKLFANNNKKEYDAHKEKRMADGITFNHKGSFMNTLMCDFENKILMAMWQFYKNVNTAVLCFDGIMLRLIENHDYDIKQCEEFVYQKCDINITLKIKPMTEGFDFTDRTIEIYNDIDSDKAIRFKNLVKSLNTYIQNGDINDNTLSIVFCNMVGDDLIVVNDNGDGYMWDISKRLWLEKTANELMIEICNEDNLILKAVRSLKDKFLTTLANCEDKEEKKSVGLILKCIDGINNKIQSTRGIKDIYTLAKNRFRNDDFKTKIINRSHDLLPIKGGNVIDLRDGKIRVRLRQDYFSIECPVSYIKKELWTEKDKETHNKFVHQIFMENDEYINYKQVKMGSYLSGRNCRDIDINHGYGKNGKSTMTNCLKIIMGDFLGYIGKNVIVFDPKAHRKKGDGHTSHLIPIEGKRVIITQELEENDTIDSEMVKKIASADPIEGVRECFGKKTYTMFPFCKLVIPTNKIPKFDVNDVAIIDRLVFNPYKSRFLNKEDMEKEKATGKYDESVYKYYIADGDLITEYSKEGRPIDILFSWLIEGCIEFYRVKNDGIKKPNIVKEYIENKVGENDVIKIWMDEKCNIKTRDEWNTMDKEDKKEFMTSSNKLYDNFSEWAIKNDCHAGFGKIKFNERLNASFTKKRNNQGMYYERIQIATFEDAD